MRRSTRFRIRCTALAAAALVFAASAQATPRDQARRMHDRLVGVPPSAAVLSQMEALIAGGSPSAAADLAMNHPDFYRTALKNWITPWTNVEGTPFAPLNDYSATVIGIVRDERPFTDVLSADLVYVGTAQANVAAWSQTNNDHYAQLEANRVDLSNAQLFTGVPQSTRPNSQLTAGDTAGVLTTRAAGEAFFSAGTNRRMLRFTAMNYLCRDMEALNDVTRPVDRIRQDVTRSPGGDSSIFHNTCTGCHSGMDPMAGAFAYFNWDATAARVVHTPGQVQPKFLINSSVFPYGYVTTNNRWDNYWRAGQNAYLNWRGPASGGFGAKSLGVEIASSRAFSECQVQKVFERVCFRPVGNQTDRDELQRIANAFEADNYNLKTAFAETATYCMGQ
jgi:hypothetical protein